MSRKKFPPRPDGEKIFVSRSSPLPVSVPLDSLERVRCGLFAYPWLSSSSGDDADRVLDLASGPWYLGVNHGSIRGSFYKKGCSIKRDVKKKVSPSTGRREDFCLEIQPTACECAPRFAREVPLWLVCISVAFIFQW